MSIFFGKEQFLVNIIKDMTLSEIFKLEGILSQ